MRRLVLTLSCFALTIFVGGARAEQPFRVSGFFYSTLEGGTHFFSCEAASCGVGSAISLERQSGTQDISTVDYEAYSKRAHAATASGQVRSFGKAISRNLGGRRILQIPFVAAGSGKRTHWIAGFILGGAQRISLVVSAPSPALARSNFDQFARRLVTW